MRFWTKLTPFFTWISFTLRKYCKEKHRLKHQLLSTEIHDYSCSVAEPLRPTWSLWFKPQINLQSLTKEEILLLSKRFWYCSKQEHLNSAYFYTKTRTRGPNLTHLQLKHLPFFLHVLSNFSSVDFCSNQTVLLGVFLFLLLNLRPAAVTSNNNQSWQGLTFPSYY